MILMTEVWEEYYQKIEKEGIPEPLKGPRKQVRDIVPLLKKRGVKRILDLGCGFGRHLLYLLEQGFDVSGQELSETALRMCRRALEEKGLQAELVHSSMIRIPFPDNHFDAVLCITTLAHARKKEIEQAVREVHRVLRKGGLFFFNVPSRGDSRYGKGEEVEPGTFLTEEYGYGKGIKELHHFFTKEELLELLKDWGQVIITEHEMRKGRIKGFYVLAVK